MQHTLPRRACVPLLAAALAACADGPTETFTPERCGEGEVALEVGQTADLAAAGDGSLGCDLQAAAGAEYALAFLDTRAIRASETGPEGYSNSFPNYAVTVDVNGGGGAPASPPAAARMPADAGLNPHDEELFAANDPRLAAAAAGTLPWERAAPWSVGEEFQLFDQFQGVDRTARVMRVYDGYFVVAWYVGDGPEHVDRYLQAFDEAMPIIRQRSIPLIRDVLGDFQPLTSTGSGQYLLLLRTGGIANASAWASTQVLGEDTVRNWLTFKLFNATFNSISMASLITHEVTHSFQRIYMNTTRAPGGPLPAAGAALWGVEGGANLTSYELVRQLAGVGFDDNFDWQGGQGTSPARDYYALRAQPGVGSFTDAYDNSMGFMRDLVIRRLAKGESLGSALREVSRGVIEGWHGYDHAGGRREGLTGRMRDRLGGDWNPADAMLTWGMSHAADDLTPNSLYQDRASLRVSQYSSPTQYGWHPSAVLSGAPQTATVSRKYGSPGYMYLQDAGGGVQLAARSTTDGVRWLLLRIR